MAMTSSLKQNNAHVYINDLLNALNKYEGHSLYFEKLNNELGHSLHLLLINNEHEEAIKFIKNILRTKRVRNHPLLKATLLLLTNKKLTKKQQEIVTPLLKKHLHYPLQMFIHASFNKSTNIRLTRNSDPLICYYYLNSKNNYNASELKHLEYLSTLGFTWATLRLLIPHIKNEDLASFNKVSAIAAAQSGRDQVSFIQKVYESHALEVGLDNEFGRLLADKSLSDNKFTLLKPLIAYYEKVGNKNKSLYYLTIAASLNDKDATQKLITYYKDDTEMVQFLKNKLIITKVE